MRNELQAAADFLANHFVEDQEIANAFNNATQRILQEHFQNHWYQNEPDRGKGFRCLQYAPPFIDPLLLKAAETAKVKDAVFFRGPETPTTEFYLWINPGEVKVSMGREPSKYIYSEKTENPYGALRMSIEKTLVDVKLETIPYETQPPTMLPQNLSHESFGSYGLNDSYTNFQQPHHARDGHSTPPSLLDSLPGTPNMGASSGNHPCPPPLGSSLGPAMVGAGGLRQMAGVIS